MDVGAAVGMVEHRWGLTGAGAYAIVNGLTASIHLPEAEAVVHVSRVLPSSARVRALQQARARLADRGVPVVGLLPSMDGAFWQPWHDRYVEVESWLPHDGRMNTWESLRAGAGVLADVHNAWADLDLGAAGEECSWANWVSAPDAAARAPAAAQLLTEWGLRDLACDVVLLSRLSGVDASLPRQVVHGDFWDNNVYLRGEKIIAVTDFDFLGR